MESKTDLQERIFRFAVRTLKMLKQLPVNPENQVARHQLGKSATSVGANYQEAQAGISRADFKNKVKIALKESRESFYWLRILEATNIKINKDEMKLLLAECKEIMLMLGAIVRKMEKGKDR